MREKEWKFVVTFHSVTEALIMERYCKGRGLPGRLIPVPRQISSSCGTAWSAPAEAKAAVQEAMSEGKIRAEGEYELLL